MKYKKLSEGLKTAIFSGSDKVYCAKLCLYAVNNLEKS